MRVRSIDGNDGQNQAQVRGGDASPPGGDDLRSRFSAVRQRLFALEQELALLPEA